MQDLQKQQRKGKFTSSRINELLGIKGLGKTGETYAFEMAEEFVMGCDPDDDYISFDMQRGLDLEPIAFENFAESIKKDFQTVSTCEFFELNEYTGGTPDGMVDGKYPLEIKCPKRKTFMMLLLTGEIDPKYIDQMQHQMLVTDAPKAYFRCFIIHQGEPIGHTIIVQRDEERIALIKERLKEAIVLREGCIKVLTVRVAECREYVKGLL